MITWRILSIVLAAFSAGLIPPAAKEAGTWEQWRGPRRDGISKETGLLKEWPKQGPGLLWKITGMGTGFSSLAIAEGKAFTLGDHGKDQKVIAVDLAAKKIAWSSPIGGSWDDNGARGTPTVDGGFLYAIGTHGDLVCLETSTGKEVWRKSFRKDFNGEMMSGWGFSESPLVDGNTVVCTPGGKDAMMAGLDKRTGAVLWKTPYPELGDRGKDGAGYSSIIISEACGIRQYVQLIGRGVVGVSAKDGKFLWGYNRIANGTANIPTPIVTGDFIFCSTGYGTGSALLKLLKNGGGIKAQEVYFLDEDKLQNHHGGLILVGDYIYGGHGHNNGFPICVEMKTGKVKWGGKVRGPGKGSAAVVYADSRLYFRYEDGTMALIEATPAGYKLKGSFPIPDSKGPSWSHPVVAGGKLYLRNMDELLCYNLKG